MVNFKFQEGIITSNKRLKVSKGNHIRKEMESRERERGLFK